MPANGPSEPDFLCAGMEKAATGWLFNQLRSHPDFWIPPVKELRYLHVPVPRMESTVRLAARVRQQGEKGLSQADLAFLREAQSLVRQPRDLDKYAALFRFKAGRVSGDISPIYSSLDGEDVAAASRRFPNIKVVLMVREPVERAWSFISQRHRGGGFDPALLEDVPAFAKWFKRYMRRHPSFATQTFRRWREFAPSVPFRFYFFDDIAARPDVVRAGIVGFLGGDPGKASGTLDAGYNGKATAQKLPLSAPIEAVLVEQLADEIREAARLFGGPAEGWPGRYGL